MGTMVKYSRNNCDYGRATTKGGYILRLTSNNIIRVRVMYMHRVEVRVRDSSTSTSTLARRLRGAVPYLSGHFAFWRRRCLSLSGLNIYTDFYQLRGY